MPSSPLRSYTLPTLSSYVSMVSLAAAVNSAPVCLTAIAAGFGLSESEMGEIPGAIFLGVVLGICLSGPLSDRLGMKPFLLLGAGGQAAGMCCVALAPGHSALLGAAFVAGLGAGVLDALLSPLVCALRPDEKPQAMNLLHAFYCIGAALTVLTAMLLLRLGCTWRTVFGVGVSPSVVAFVGLALSHIPASSKGDDGYVPLGRLCRSGRFLLLVFAMLLCGGTELGPAQWFPAYVERALGWQRSNSALALLLFSSAMAAGRLAASRLATRIPATQMIVGSAVACALMVLLMSQPYSAALSLVSGALLGVSVAALWPTTLALTAGQFPGGGAAMFSTLAAFGNAGGMLVPWAMGLVAKRTDMHWALGSVVVLPLLLIVTLALASHSKEV